MCVDASVNRFTYAASLTIVVSAAVSTTTAAATSLAETLLNGLNSVLNIIVRAANFSCAVTVLKKFRVVRNFSKRAENICCNLQRRLPCWCWCAHCIRIGAAGWWLHVGQWACQLSAIQSIQIPFFWLFYEWQAKIFAFFRVKSPIPNYHFNSIYFRINSCYYC